MGSHSGVSWRYTAVGVLAGVGAGYLLGVVSSKWLWRQKPRPRPRPGDPELIAALAALTSEVAGLRQAIELGRLDRTSRRPMQRESVTDFLSAQGDPEQSEDEGSESFFTPGIDNTGEREVEDEAEDEEAESGSDQQRYAYIDELGKKTLESEEACTNVIEQLRSRLEEHPSDVGYLWRLARALVHLSIHQVQKGDTEEEKQLLRQATEYGQQALSIDSNVWQAHQWYGVSMGSLIKYRGTQERIEQGFEYKDHIDTAISLNPEEPTLYYLRGRWCFEVAGISWLERKGAAALYASPPESSFDEALQNFMKTEELKPDQWKGNMLMVAKCQLKLGDVPTAVEWLHKASQLPTVTSEDHGSHKEIQELLAQHDEDFTEY